MGKQKKVQKKVKKQMMIGEVLEKYPETAMVMMNSGLHCIGCHVAVSESIEDGARAHGMSDEQIDKMVEDMNKSAEQSK